MADVRYWIAGSQAFGYTPHRQADGKFYALKYRYDKTTGRGATIKKRAFGRRKKAKKAFSRLEWIRKVKKLLGWK